MPSPPIPCSKSAPNISTFPHSLSHSDLHKSVRSAGSLTTAWPKKLGNLITRKGSPSSKNAGLTEENLQEFNRRNAILETRYATCSPYYKGLTDFSLVINREKLSGSSPGRESHTETFVSSGSKSSFVVKVQKWSTSCYTTKKHDQPSSSSSSFWSKSSGHTRAVTSDSSSSKTTATGMIITNIRTKTKTNDSESEWKKVKAEERGHFIFEGLPGVGKRTMIWALLREAFGANNVQGEGVGSVLVNLMVSQQHIEVNLSELKGYEKHILVELIKERSTKLSNKALQRNHEDCKAIILYEADKISTDTLTYIKWILERFKGCNKVFFCCSDISKLEPVKSLCTVVQLLPPSTEEIVEVLEFIAKQEGIHLPHQLAVKFANKSNNNLRQAIRSFEATWHFK
ncbi:replication factor C subunit 3-like [Forsythia ovata]|uniref:Replication factor C subunit 3-like n=1 Tax=Forsythia ovata TaxID=205694 RepID=A0ABD1VHC3_9LAMI